MDQLAVVRFLERNSGKAIVLKAKNMQTWVLLSETEDEVVIDIPTFNKSLTVGAEFGHFMIKQGSMTSITVNGRDVFGTAIRVLAR